MNQTYWMKDIEMFYSRTMKTKMSWEETELIRLAATFTHELFENINKELCSDCNIASTEHHVADKESGCCKNCANNNGFFKISNIHNHMRSSQSSDTFKRLRRKFTFTKQHGFFDPIIHCCKLPRYARSVTCLTYCCEKARNKMTKAEERALEMVYWSILTLKSRLNIFY